MTDTIDPPDDLDAVRTSYDAVADNYVSMGMGDLGPTPWLRAALNAFAEQVRDIGPVLDAGCGPGTTSGYLHALGVEVCGIDLSPRMIEHARRLHPGVPFKVASTTEEAPAAESLGGVLGWWSWFNLPRSVLPQVIARMARALRPGGQLLVGTHCGDGDIRRTSGYGAPAGNCRAESISTRRTGSRAPTPNGPSSSHDVLTTATPPPMTSRHLTRSASRTPRGATTRAGTRLERSGGTGGGAVGAREGSHSLLRDGFLEAF